MAKASRGSRKKTMSDYDGPMVAQAPSVSGRVKRGKTTLSSVRVERAKNGYTVSKSYEGPHGEYVPSGKSEVYTDAESMIASLKQSLG